jgi:hypothetical protein
MKVKVKGQTARQVFEGPPSLANKDQVHGSARVPGLVRCAVDQVCS